MTRPGSDLLLRWPRHGAALGLAGFVFTGCYGGGAGQDSDTDGPDTATASATASATATATAGDTDPNDPTGDGPEEVDPGRVTVHRLNRTEYNNTVRDLLGTELRPADSFPADDYSLGFDNISDVLSTTPLQAELYERAATDLINEAMELPITAAGKWQVEAESALSSVGGKSGDAWNLYSNGEVYQTIDLPFEGEYTFKARVWGQQGGPDLPHMVLAMDEAAVGEFDVEAVQNAAEVYEVKVKATKGVHKFAVKFTNDYYDEPAMADRNLLVDYFVIEGPLNLPQGENDKRGRIMICDPAVDGEDACLRQILEQFGKRAWRRPLTGEELDRLMQFIASAKTSGGTWEEGLRLGLQAVLVSPFFVYRVELDPTPTDLTPHPLSDHELASRLSYFLWSSMPDDELFKVADSGTLHEPDVLEAQARRMLADPRARALIDNFAGLWWKIREVPYAFKDVYLYPQWDDAMKQAMKTEMELFAEEFLLDDRNMLESLTAKDTHVNALLAKHYGLEGVEGDEFVSVDLGDRPFQGLLTKAGLMTVLSHADHTSPVKRGKFVLDSLLCTPPAPPPPEADTKLDLVPGKTQREILEAHRQDPACSICHDTMDPPGFALEHYDPLGAWRDTENGLTINPTGTLPNGAPFADALEMQLLISQQPDYLKCVTRKAFIYSLGRNLGPRDLDYIDAMFADFTGNENRFSELVVALVSSEPFRMRRGDPAE